MEQHAGVIACRTILVIMPMFTGGDACVSGMSAARARALVTRMFARLRRMERGTNISAGVLVSQ